VTDQEKQDRLSAARAFTRPRRLTAAVALSVGVGSLVYGSVLALPASAATTASPSAACSTASVSPSNTATKSDSGTATPGITGSDSPTATATASGTPSDPGSPSATPTQCATDTATASDTDTATASVAPSKPGSTGVGGGLGAPTVSSAPTTASATPTPSKSKTGTSSGGSGTTGSKPKTPTPTAATSTTRAAEPGTRVPDEDNFAQDFEYTAAPPGNAPYQLTTTSITRAQIIARAQLWVQQQVPYSQTEWWTNPDGTYRQDCSGFVSMAWDLNQNTDFWTGNLNLVSHTVAAADLLPGDNLLSDEHTILFAGWANAQHTEFDYYEEAHPGTVARYVVDAPLSAFLDNGFVPFRYDGVVNSATLPANPASGDLYSTLALKASEINPPGVLPGEPLGLGQASGSASATAASASSRPTHLSAQIAADDAVGSEGTRSEGAALGAAGIFLLGAGLLIRRPAVLRGRRGRH
jgi:hypothetical protein